MDDGHVQEFRYKVHNRYTTLPQHIFQSHGRREARVLPVDRSISSPAIWYPDLSVASYIPRGSLSGLDGHHFAFDWHKNDTKASQSHSKRTPPDLVEAEDSIPGLPGCQRSPSLPRRQRPLIRRRDSRRNMSRNQMITWADTREK